MSSTCRLLNQQAEGRVDFGTFCWEQLVERCGTTSAEHFDVLFVPRFAVVGAGAQNPLLITCGHLKVVHDGVDAFRPRRMAAENVSRHFHPGHTSRGDVL